jgi:glycosyltransferase involved in cell wall biosynthesis
VKVLIFAPNAGISLSQGGGTNFVLKQARALARLGHQITLAGYHALPLATLERNHGVDLGPIRGSVRIRGGPGARAFATQRRLPGKPSPYLALLDPRVGNWLRSTLEREDPDLVWFHDDVPRAVRGASPRARRLLYVHFPLQARSATVVPALRTSRSPGEAAQDALLRRLASRLVETDVPAVCEQVQANSSVTAEACSKVWSIRPTIVPTYAPPRAPPNGGRRPSAISVATFQPGKQLETIVEGFRGHRGLGSRLQLFGHGRDPAYLARLQRSAGGDRRIRFEVDAPRPRLEEALGTARSIVAAPVFEPFGLGVLEGMQAGATPVVREGPGSGPWLDLLGEGRWGHGFRSIAELTDRFDRLFSDPGPTPPDLRAARRAESFSEERLMADLAGVVR